MWRDHVIVATPKQSRPSLQDSPGYTGSVNQTQQVHCFNTLQSSIQDKRLLKTLTGLQYKQEEGEGKAAGISPSISESQLSECCESPAIPGFLAIWHLAIFSLFVKLTQGYSGLYCQTGKLTPGCSQLLGNTCKLTFPGFPAILERKILYLPKFCNKFYFMTGSTTSNCLGVAAL